MTHLRLVREGRAYVREARRLGRVVTVGDLVAGLYDAAGALDPALDGPDMHRLVVAVLCDVAAWAKIAQPEETS